MKRMNRKKQKIIKIIKHEQNMNKITKNKIKTKKHE